tara:strand:- start:314 stop:658 length:345 start_codon:yes stop_codon:yes gene_type:complete
MVIAAPAPFRTQIGMHPIFGFGAGPYGLAGSSVLTSNETGPLFFRSSIAIPSAPSSSPFSFYSGEGFEPLFSRSISSIDPFYFPTAATCSSSSFFSSAATSSPLTFDYLCGSLL